MSFQNHLFSESHEWIESAGDVRTVGITDHAQHLLGDIVYVELPKAGTTVKKGDPIVTVESPKAAAEVYAPVSGEIVEVNGALEGEPSLINGGPYGDGWMVRIRPSDTSEFGKLMGHADYQKLTEG